MRGKLRQKLQKESSFSEEKEAKRLLRICHGTVSALVPTRLGAKVFCFFFSKKKTFLFH
jgi:hypothetical protein